MASLKRTNLSMFSYSASSGRPTPTASGSSARRRLLTTRRPGLTVAGYKRRAPTAALDTPYNSSNLQAAVQHNADKEKEKAVEANRWTSVSTPCQKWRRSRLLLPSQHHHVEALARPVAQHQNSGEKEKTSVMALLRHVHLPYSVAFDTKLLETSHGLGTGGPARRAIAVERSDRGRKYGTLKVAGKRTYKVHD